MPDDTLDPVAGLRPESPASQWEWWHTVALFLVAAFLVWMAIRQPWGIYTSWIVVMLALLAFILIAGLGIKGVMRGALIDERNKISLSRFQMLTWTIVVLAAYGTIVIARAKSGDPLTALDVKIPQTLLLLMGISTTSLVGSPLIKSTKKEPALGLKSEENKKLLTDQGSDPDTCRVEGQIVHNRNFKDAKWSDLFTGEEVANVTHLDLAKIQMFFFTGLVVLSYTVAIGQLLQETATSALVSLPEVGDGMVTLLGISHSGYLVHKAVPVTKPQHTES